MLKYFTILTLALLICFSCKKEKTTWQTNWSTPLLKGSFNISNTLPDNYIDNDDDYLSLIFKDTLYSFRIDTLIKLPDTTLSHKSGIAFPSLTLGPGNLISNTGINQVYNLGDINLKRVIVREGKGFLSIVSPWQGKTKAHFVFPKLKDGNGNVFERTYELDPGTLNDPFIVVDSFNMSDFDFDLTGADGSLFNNITASLTMSSNEETASFVVTNLDTVEMLLSFTDMSAKYAKGYFGEYLIQDQDQLSIPEFKKLDGILNFDSIKISLDLENSFDIIAQAKINKFEGTNTSTNQTVDLLFPQLGQFINLNPATGGIWSYQPSIYNIAVNNTNSNTIEFAQNFPNSILYDYVIHVNPYGNIGAGTDQYFENSMINIMMDAELPLNILMNNFSLVDTFEIDIKPEDINELESGEILINYTNGFPVSAEPILYILDENNSVKDSILSTTIIKSGIYDINSESTSITTGQLVFLIDDSRLTSLKEGTQMAFKIIFNSFDQSKTKINLEDEITFQLYSNLKLNLSL